MTFFWILLAVLGVLALIVLLIAYICYRMAFYLPRVEMAPGEIPLPEGAEYEPYHEKMRAWVREARALPQEAVEIRSFDGLRLRGIYYEYAPGAPIELMFHGYRGTSERDLSGGVQRCFALGRSALLVDQRGCGKSEGHAATFGVREHRDCLAWIDFMLRRFGPEVRIILTGISMGAATVLMAAGETLPPQVKGVLADCGFSSAREIIRIVIEKRGLPVAVAYPFVRLGARIFAGFDLEANPPIEAVRRAKVPVIFFHGEADDFVPCDMSRALYAACASRKCLVTVPGAAHGLSYPVDREGYLAAVRKFWPTESGTN